MSKRAEIGAVIQAPPLVDQVYEHLLEAICTGVLEPGDAVRQQELAKSLGVSRLPVLIALGQLRREGFLVARGRRGLQVAPINRTRFDAIYELRSSVDALAAALAATRASKQDLQIGRKILERGRNAAMSNDPRAVLTADVEFHEWVYRASGNALILEAMKTQWLHLRRSMGEVLRHRELINSLWDEHSSILEAISHRSSAEAATAASSHVTAAHSRVGTLLESALALRACS